MSPPGDRRFVTPAATLHGPSTGAGAEALGLRPGRDDVVGPGLLRARPRAGLHAPGTMALRRKVEGREVGWAELILRQDGWFTDGLQARAGEVLRLLQAARIGGTWWGAAPGVHLAGCTAVFAGRDPAVTRRMLDAAAGTPGAVLVVRRAGRWTGLCRRRGIDIIAGVVDPWPILEQAACVHAEGGADVALLAGLLGRRVRPSTPGPLSLTRDPLRLAAAALLLGTRYADPFSGAAISCEEYLTLAAAWRQPGAAGVACCVGISFWKRRRIAAMLGGPRPPAFRRTAAGAVAAAGRRNGEIAVWPSRAPAGLDARAAAAGVPVARVEDGFVRSVGLGADFLPPLSIVLDRRGLYYDATGPSDLEEVLASHRFTPALLARAAALRERMVRDKVTKYNLVGEPAAGFPAGRRLVLVPGQVADDRSVLLGGAGVRPGLDLLRRVRARMPGAWIVYKPHPDVDAGHRAGAVPDAEALRHADQVVRGGSMAELLAQVDEVHTLTSLTGFEPLLRGKAVTTYGQPFYAGWGLTADANPVARRTRRLTLDALVAGTMILYPRYFDPVTALPCGPEIVLDRLADPASSRVSLLVRARRLQGRAFMFARRLARTGLQAWRSPRVRDTVR